MSENKKQLSTEPYRGTRDFYPQDMAVEKFIFQKMREVVEKYGYVEYGAPLLESLDLYRAKTGEEIVSEQLYSFTDKGEREVAIRPEMTPSVARMIARKRKELSFPLRWYSLPNLYRYERPQRGRLREHVQLNVDLFGVEGAEADAEVIAVAYNIMKALGMKDGDFEVRVNDKRLTSSIIQSAITRSESDEKESEITQQVMKVMDKKNKVSDAELRGMMQKVVGEGADALCGDLDGYAQGTKTLVGVAEGSWIKELQDRLSTRGVATVYDPWLTRGFDYYTSTVFEVFDINPQNNRSLFGGGRYDDLLDIFGEEKVPAVGFGMGNVTIRDTLETYGLLPEARSSTDLYMCVLEESARVYANEFAEELRAAGVKVAVDLTSRKAGAQVRSADRDKILFVVCIGGKEAEAGEFRIKNLSSGEEKAVNRSEVVGFLRSHI